MGIVSCADDPHQTPIDLVSHDESASAAALFAESDASGATPLSDAGSKSTAPAAADGAVQQAPFALVPIGFPTQGGELSFPPTAYPPTNQSPAFRWSGVPSQAKSLALVFRDLGNDAIKWIIWDIPPNVTELPANIAKVARPPEVPMSSQLGSLNNVGYAGPGMGARLYDFTLWAMTVERLPSTARRTTAQIFNDVLPRYRLAKSSVVVARNTRNLR